MKAFNLKLCDETWARLNPSVQAGLEIFLHEPKTQTVEMIRQINSSGYYNELFCGKRDLTFVDLGSNIGLVSIFAAPACSKILAVEPEPRTFRALQALTESYRTVINCAQVALVPVSGPVSLSVDKRDNSCHTAINPKPGNPTVSVRGLSFLDLLGQYGLKKVDVCKVDVEGSEMDCLDKPLFQSGIVATWYIEVHRTRNSSREVNMGTMMGRLIESGLKLSCPRANAIIART